MARNESALVLREDNDQTKAVTNFMKTEMGPLLQRIQKPLKNVRKKFEAELGEADLFRESLHLLGEALKFSVIPAIILEFLNHLRLLTSEKYGAETADNLVMGVWFLRGLCPCLLSELNTRNVLAIPKVPAFSRQLLLAFASGLKPKTEGEAAFHAEGKLLVKAFLRKLATAPLNVEFEPTGSLAGTVTTDCQCVPLYHMYSLSLYQCPSTVQGQLTPRGQVLAGLACLFMPSALFFASPHI